MDWREEYREALLGINPDAPDIRKIVSSHIPLKLYKYGNFRNSYWKDIIYNAKIHLSPASEFNDPFDCKIKFDYQKAIRKGKFRETLLRVFPNIDLDENLSQEIIQKDIIESMQNSTFVSCFSETWSSLLMWAHYSNNYNGYCIEYDTKLISDTVKYNLYPVLYENEYVDITEQLINLNRNSGRVTNLTKAIDWSYEKEWRIVEYKENPFYLRKSLKSVYLGKNVERDKDEIVHWAKQNKKQVYLVSESKIEYKLEADRIV